MLAAEAYEQRIVKQPMSVNVVSIDEDQLKRARGSVFVVGVGAGGRCCCCGEVSASGAGWLQLRVLRAALGEGVAGILRTFAFILGGGGGGVPSWGILAGMWVIYARRGGRCGCGMVAEWS